MTAARRLVAWLWTGRGAKLTAVVLLMAGLLLGAFKPAIWMW